MLQKIPLQNILFLDIETVPESETFEALSSVEKQLWEKKTAYQRKEEHTPEDFYERAGIWAEFGKIICISVGFFVIKNDTRNFRVSSFSGEERSILQDFGALLNDYFNGPQHLLCGHNGKEFDFPYIARRMLIHNIKLPNKLNLFGKKPWEIPHLDTMELWRFGDYKHFTSLALLTHVLQIPTPKDDIDGSQVAAIYYQEKNLERIVRYCEKDTIAVAQVFLRLRGEAILTADEIVSV
ncbi:MAG: 3'-5' exonuclease [Flavobacteriaceae bacterium]|nr:3'-5' exonuclease [Flavobacteriaceae bacterium]